MDERIYKIDIEEAIKYDPLVGSQKSTKKITLPFKKSERGTHTKLVTVHGKKTTFKRKQRVGKKEPEKKVDDKKQEWQDWQQYYREELYRPSASSHEDYVSQSIMIAESLQHAKALIRRFQKKDPSSMGIDLSADLEILYRQTKDQVPKKVTIKGFAKSSLHPDNLTKINSFEDSGINVVPGVHEEETFICKFKDGSSSIHKTMLAGDIAGEVGTYEISKIIGWDIIPETIQCDYGKGKGSSQKWIKDGCEPTGDFFDGVNLGEKHLNDLSKIYIMDMVLGNFDRHDGNLIIDKNDHVWGIDNECIGKLNNSELHIEALESFAKDGHGFPVPMMGVLENNFGDDPKMFQNFKDHVDKNLDMMLNKKDEIMKYWNQYKDETKMKAFLGAIPMKDAVKNIKKNIEYLEGYKR